MLFFSLIMLLLSCRPFSMSDYITEKNIGQKLPKLKVEFDKESFGPYINPYDVALDVMQGRPDIAETYTRKVRNEKAMANDVSLIFSRELINNISTNKGPVAGYIYCSQRLRNAYIKNYWPPIISVVTLGIANICGMKFKRLVYEVEIEVDVYDLNDQIISNYIGFGKGEADMKMYTGYSERGTQRAAFSAAFLESVKSVKAQMSKDQEMLQSALIR